MAESTSGVTNGGYGDVRCYVSAYVESYTDKQAVVRVYGAVYGHSSYGPWGFGVRNRVGVDGIGSADYTGWLNYGDWIAAGDYRVTVERGNGRWLRCSTSFWGETVSGYGAYPYSNSAAVDVYVEPQVLRPPSAPSGLAAQRTAAGVIGVTWRNNASNASSTLVERKPYGGTWATILDRPEVLTSYADSVGAGTFAYRARYWNADGFSGYSNESEWVTALCAPAAPTCVLPASGATLDSRDGSPTLSWRHNSLDTSSQTAAEVRYTLDGWSTETVIGSSGSDTTVPVSGNADVQWRVRTKGAYTGDGDAAAAWSPWSPASMFRIRTAPSVAVRVDPVLVAVPLTLAWDYDDAMGTQASAVVAIIDAGGIEVFRKQVAGVSSATIAAAEFTPVNDSRYTVRVTARSTTSLQASAEAAIDVAYTPPPPPLVYTSSDSEAQAALITVEAGRGEIDTQSITVFRDGDAIASGLRSGDAIIDRTPPLDVETTYRAVAYAASGSTSEASALERTPSLGFAVVNYGPDLASIAKVRRNLSIQDGIDGERKLREVASSRYPKAFYGYHASRDHKLTGEVWVHDDASGDGGNAMLDAIKDLERDNGTAVLRLPFGEVITAALRVKHATSAKEANRASVTIDWTEVSQ